MVGIRPFWARVPAVSHIYSQFLCPKPMPWRNDARKQSHSTPVHRSTGKRISIQAGPPESCGRQSVVPPNKTRMKKSIDLSPNIETLFGTRDENLHVLEDGLNINIDLRSDHLELEGAPRDVARAEQLFADFDHLREAGYQFQNGDLNSMLRVLVGDPECHAARAGRSRTPALLRPPHCAAEEPEPAPLSRSHRTARHGVRRWPRWHRQILSRGCDGDFRAVE